MKEHPILFTGPNVGLILADLKMQTRRVVRFPRHTYQGDAGASWVASVNPDGRDGWVAWGPTPMTDEQSKRMYSHGGGFRCPYGVVGDTLWCKETWWAPPGATSPEQVAYRANLDEAQANCQTWRPSIFMPRWASRLLLEVTQVRVQRLQDITEEDAIAEGVLETAFWQPGLTAREAYRAEWEAINGKKHPWASNPLVWAVTFRRLPERRVK